MILTSKDMWPAAKKEWLELVDKQAYVKWVYTMHERRQDVIKARGFSTKW